MVKKEKIIAELVKAISAQSEGNQGMARVCSRRAVGWAIKFAFQENHPILTNKTAFECIKYWIEKSQSSQEITHKLGYFTQKVVKDSFTEDSYFPLTDIDIVKEAHQIVEEILGETISSQ